MCQVRFELIDLSLEESDDCRDDYLLIGGKRICGDISKQAQNITIVSFNDDLLPRQVDILFHTNGYQNTGRGFKLLYEQLPCDTSSTSNAQIPQLSAPTTTRNEPNSRDARRMKFGELSYPHNYVSMSSPSSTRTSNSMQNQRNHHSTSRNVEVEPQETYTSLSKDIVVTRSAQITIR